MHPLRLALLVVNVLGGLAVLGSYAHGISTHAQAGDALWGNLPATLRPLYTVSMLLAAAGYLMCFPVLLHGVDPEGARFFGGHASYLVVVGLYVLVLVPSTLWMPLTFSYVAAPSPQGWFAVRAVLALVGLGAVGLVVAVVTVEPTLSSPARVVATVGAVLFAFHTLVLDAIVWPALYR